MSIALTDREADLMQVLWDHGPSLVAEVREHLADPLAYTTVLTVLRILESKGYVGHTEEGRVHRYFATVEKQTARKSALRHLTDKLFEGSSELLMTQLVSDHKLSDEQVQRLRRLLASKRGRSKS
jgi:predicted transcriptional regulator